MPEQMHTTEETTVVHSQKWLAERLKAGDTALCPTCVRVSKIYPMKIDSAMARTLIVLYRTAGTDYYHVPSLPGDNHKVSQLSWWGLVEELQEKRPDGGRGGWWRVTALGEAFVLAKSVVPHRVGVWDANVVKVYGDKLVTIHAALGDKFSYSELMA